MVNNSKELYDIERGILNTILPNLNGFSRNNSELTNRIFYSVESGITKNPKYFRKFQVPNKQNYFVIPCHSREDVVAIVTKYSMQEREIRVYFKDNTLVKITQLKDMATVKLERERYRRILYLTEIIERNKL